MFNANSKNKPDPDHPGNARLKALLQQWRGIEPSATFEAAVWRHIRAAAVEGQQVPRLWSIARTWLSAESAWVPAMAAAGLLLGVALALAMPQARPYYAAPLVNSQTLAGAYLGMASGGIR